jgi:hypothetical protein
MNIYVVVEGIAEKVVYPSWIPLVNPLLSHIIDLTQIRQNNFFIFSAGGYPKIFDAIDGAIDDIKRYRRFNRLVISVDSEDMTRNEKYNEFTDYLATRNIPCETRIIVQDFCFETWALGNRKIIRPISRSERLQHYRALFDVRVRDPELLPEKPYEDFNRAQFAEKYLQLVMNDVKRSLTYSKGRPYPVYEDYYFEQVRNRYQQANHIRSFNGFLSAFL